jgi:two-component system, NtrC family, sensor kinase
VTIRTKVWLLVAVSVIVTAGATFWLRIYAMRRELIRQALASADEIADDIRQTLERFDADAEDRDLAIALSNYINRHPRIQRLQLVIERESATRIFAQRGEATEITRLGSIPREPIIYTRKATEGDDIQVVSRTVDLKGPWIAVLSMNWSLGPVQSVIKVTERWSLLLGLGQLMVLMFLSGFIIDRVVLRRLDILARAMRDVEAGDMDRRVPSDTEDEVGRLSHGFNRMLEQLSSANREIHAFNQRLAREIEMATQDLSRKNMALEQLNRLLNESRRENASKVRLAALGQLAAQLAHEIGTPLSSVSGHLQLALSQRDLSPSLRERLDVSTREIARIGRIVRDYLDSTRSLEAERKLVSLRQVLSEAVEVTRGGELGSNKTLNVDLPNDPADFVTDPGLLRQIVINLLSNALDAVEQGGLVALTAQSQDDHVVITVRDTGTGIAPEDLRRIFEPFYTTKGRGKGTGLGLAICRELAKALGGIIAVESTPGQGSAFTLRLPRNAQAEPASPRAAAGGAV